MDVWEAANRDDLFSVTSLKHYPYVANSDFHKAEASLLVEDAGAVGEDVAGRQGRPQIERRHRHHAVPKGFLLVSRVVPRVVIIINPISGPRRRGHRRRARRGRDAHARPAGREGEIRLTERAGHAHELALEAAASGAELVIAWGGDGTINEVGRALVQRGDARSARAGTRHHSRRVRATASHASWAFRSILRGRSSAHVRATARRRRCGRDRRPSVLQCGGHRARRARRRARLDARASSRPAAVSDGERRRSPSLPAGRIHDRRSTAGRPRRPRSCSRSRTRSSGASARRSPHGADLEDGLLDFVVVHDRGFVGNMLRVPALFAGRIDRQRRHRYAPRARGHDSVARGDAVSRRRGSGAGLRHARGARASRARCGCGRKAAIDDSQIGRLVECHWIEDARTKNRCGSVLS